MTAWNESGPGNVGIENGIGLANDQNKVHEIEDAPEPPNTSITSCDMEDNLITVHATENEQSNTHETRESSNILETCHMEDSLLTENKSFSGRALETLVEVEGGVEEEVSLSSDSSSSKSVTLHISVNIKVAFACK